MYRNLWGIGKEIFLIESHELHERSSAFYNVDVLFLHAEANQSEKYSPDCEPTHFALCPERSASL